MAGEKLVSADSHVIEPRNLWVDYIEPAFKEKAPRVVTDPAGLKGDHFIVEGLEPTKVAGGFAAGIPSEKLKKHKERSSMDDCPLGAFIPEERLPDMELDGIEAEVIYTTHGFGLFSLTDAPFQQAIFRAYNTWMGEFCSYDPKHLIGLGLVPLLDVEEGIKELKRCAKLGLRGGTIMVSPPEGLGYDDPIYEPFWAVAEDLNMPLSLHLGTGHGPESKMAGKFKNNVNLLRMSLPHEVQRSLAEILFSGVLERYPGLKIVSAENDIGWMPHFLHRADYYYTKHIYEMPTSLKMLPSEYAKGQFLITFMDDPPGVRLADVYGEDNYAWASDYPHTDSTFPNSRRVVEENFAGVSAEIKRKITRDNVIRFYDIDLE